MNTRQERNIMRHRSHKAIARVRRVWNELDHAQRRLLEIQTGLPLAGPASRRRDDHRIARLEDLSRRGWRR
jgi:hypothetical protein